jgi:hypothetical protein
MALVFACPTIGLRVLGGDLEEDDEDDDDEDEVDVEEHVDDHEDDEEFWLTLLLFDFVSA